jgi:hypothetical protein
MSEPDLMYGVEDDTADDTLELSVDLTDESFMEDHVIILTSNQARMAARALAAYSQFLKMAPAAYIWNCENPMADDTPV